MPITPYELGVFHGLLLSFLLIGAVAGALALIYWLDQRRKAAEIRALVSGHLPEVRKIYGTKTDAGALRRALQIADEATPSAATPDAQRAEPYKIANALLEKWYLADPANRALDAVGYTALRNAIVSALAVAKPDAQVAALSGALRSSPCFVPCKEMHQAFEDGNYQALLVGYCVDQKYCGCDNAAALSTRQPAGAGRETPLDDSIDIEIRRQRALATASSREGT